MITFGFDPGKDGAIAWVSDTAFDPGVGAEPFAFVGDELDVALLQGYLFPPVGDVPAMRQPARLIIEKVGAVPVAGRKQGGKSMFTFGSGFGELKALAKLSGYPWALVPPPTWKKAVLKDTDRSKGATVAWAARTYPSLKLTRPRGGPHLGMIDALAIAHYGHFFHRW